MDKQRFVQIMNDFNKGMLNQQDAYDLIYEYCIDKGKKQEHVKLFTEFITSFTGPLFINCMNTIMQEWGTKYEIIEIHKVLPDGRTRIIKIY